VDHPLDPARKIYLECDTYRANSHSFVYVAVYDLKHVVLIKTSLHVYRGNFSINNCLDILLPKS